MLRGLLLLGATLPLLAFGGASASHVHNGLIAYAHVGNGDRSQIYSMTQAGAHRHPLTTGHRYSSYDPAYSPSGKRIAFVRATTSPDIWVMNADGTRKRALTMTDGGIEVDPAWSPNGKQIAFAVEGPTPEQGIWLLQANGKGGRVPLTHGNDTNPAWSPDGSEIAFQRRDPVTQTDAIFVVPAAGGAATDLTDDPTSDYLDPAWSPDGNWILLSSDRPDQVQLDLWALNLRAVGPGPSFVRITNTPSRDERDPAWSPDGRKIVYSGQGSFHGASSSQIYVSNADGSNRHVLTHACGECAWINDGPSWQPLP
jgi:Tol biopolymer transport system component